MTLNFLVICLISLGVYSFLFGRYRIRKVTQQVSVKQHSRDVYHATFWPLAPLLCR